MSSKLLFVDLENMPKVDLSPLDKSFKTLVFVGVHQQSAKTTKRLAAAQQFCRLGFLKISGSGKNALDFHIAFELGRIYEKARETSCFILSRDTGFDPLISYLNENGMRCHRVESVTELLSLDEKVAPAKAVAVCWRCRMSGTSAHAGAQWCINCESFATPPDAALLPFDQSWFRARQGLRGSLKTRQAAAQSCFT